MLLLLYLVTIFKHIDAFDSSWHKFKNSVMLEIMLLHLQPFSDSHLHIIVGLQSLKCCISRQNKYLPKGVILQHTVQLYTAHMWSFSTHCNCTQHTCNPSAHIAAVHIAHMILQHTLQLYTAHVILQHTLQLYTAHTWSFSTHCSCTQCPSDTRATAFVSLGIMNHLHYCLGCRSNTWEVTCAMVISGSGCLWMAVCARASFLLMWWSV